jgi:hypothetical protein
LSRYLRPLSAFRYLRSAEEAAVRDAIAASHPYGDNPWLNNLKKTLGWREPLPRGRPRKQPKSR